MSHNKLNDVIIHSSNEPPIRFLKREPNKLTQKFSPLPDVATDAVFV